MRTNRPIPNTIRLVAFDLDGTVLDQGVLREATRRAILSLHERGIFTAAATGRQYLMLPKELMELDVRFSISSNGARIRDHGTGRDLHLHPLDAVTAEGLLRFLSARCAPCCNAFTDTVNYFPTLAARVIGGFAPDRTEEFLARLDEQAVLLSDDPCKAALQKARAGLLEKIGCMLDDDETASALLRELNARFDAKILTTIGRDIEITAKGVSKGAGLKELCRQLELPLSAVLAFGDSGNDLDLLQTAGYAVALGNAVPLLCEAADRIAPPVWEDGFSRTLSALGLTDPA